MKEDGILKSSTTLSSLLDGKVQTMSLAALTCSQLKVHGSLSLNFLYSIL